VEAFFVRKGKNGRAEKVAVKTDLTLTKPSTKPTTRPSQRPNERPKPGRPTTPTHVPSEHDAPMAVIKRFNNLYDDLSKEEQEEINSHFE
jgi:hypothetical protein